MHTGNPLARLGRRAGWPEAAPRRGEDHPEDSVMPIAWGDAKPLLEAMRGPVAPEAWRGALPMTYRLGPGPAAVRLKLAFDWQNGRSTT